VVAEELHCGGPFNRRAVVRGGTARALQAFFLGGLGGKGVAEEIANVVGDRVGVDELVARAASWVELAVGGASSYATTL
jgi:hypothetical protein